jgi:hypothetical protein
MRISPILDSDGSPKLNLDVVLAVHTDSVNGKDFAVLLYHVLLL